MTTLFTPHGLFLVLSWFLVGAGLCIIVHPEIDRGASLVLIGLAVLERISQRVRRLLGAISRFFERPSGPSGGHRRRARRGMLRLQPRWQTT